MILLFPELSLRFHVVYLTPDHEEVYLYAYDRVSHAKAGLAKYFTLYITRRPHSRFDGIPPDQTYFGNLPDVRMAA